jgi:hypothetical protein
MKYSFNLIQIANWVYVIRTKLKDLRIRLDKEKISKEEALHILHAQKQSLELIKDIINKKSRLLGIQSDFIKNLKQIKKEYGIED